MLISAVVALSENRAIGKNNQLLWHLPADLAHFKQITTGKPIVMGRKTYQSIGRPLPNRSNVILTQDKQFKAEGCIIVHSIEAALTVSTGQDEMCIIGGAEIYRQFMPWIERIYLTKVHHVFPADTFFPELNADEWKETESISHPPDEKNKYSYSFSTLKRSTRLSLHET